MSDDEQVYVTDSGEEIISRSTFLGLNRNFSIDGRELSESVNMTDDDFPALATRGKRKILKLDYKAGASIPEVDSRMQNAVTMDGYAALLTAQGTLYYGPRKITGLPVAQTLTKFNRSLYLMPSGIIVECPPGDLPTISGATYTHILEIFGRAASPEEQGRWDDTIPSHRDAWSAVYPVVSNAYKQADGTPADTSDPGDPHTLIKIAIPSGQESSLREGDMIHARAATGDAQSTALLFDGDYTVEYVSADGMIIYLGSDQVITTGTTLYDLVLERKMPKLDVCFEHKGRLWGARYGENADGDFVNEIYCTALNDFEHWFRYDETAASAWTASITSEGPWTGGCVLDGYPTFFKETGYYRIFGTTPDTFQIHTKTCEGIEKGSEASAVVISGSLYYKSTNGIMKLTDALPERISGALGFDSYHNAIGGTDGIRYYVRMTDAENDDEERIYVFDTDTGLWHTQSMPYCGLGYNPEFRCFLRLGSSIYAVSDSRTKTTEEILEGTDANTALHNKVTEIQGKVSNNTATAMERIALVILKAIDDAEEKRGLRGLQNKIDILELKVSTGEAKLTDKLLLAVLKSIYVLIAAVLVQLADHYCDIELLSRCDPEDALLCMPTTTESDGQGGTAAVSVTAEEEKEVPFEAVTADIGYSTPLRKNINRMYVRALLGRYARLDVEIQYDHEDEWRHVETLHGQGKVKFCNITVRPVRCDSFRLRYSGFGDVKITETDIVYQPGSEFR